MIIFYIYKTLFLFVCLFVCLFVTYACAHRCRYMHETWQVDTSWKRAGQGDMTFDLWSLAGVKYMKFLFYSQTKQDNSMACIDHL